MYTALVPLALASALHEPWPFRDWLHARAEGDPALTGASTELVPDAGHRFLAAYLAEAVATCIGRPATTITVSVYDEAVHARLEPAGPDAPPDAEPMEGAYPLPAWARSFVRQAGAHDVDPRGVLHARDALLILADACGLLGLQPPPEAS
jgi:hypothetical protein